MSFFQCLQYSILQPVLLNNYKHMGKRTTALKGKVKSKRSHKTAKRLAIKHTMLAAKVAKKKVSRKK